MPLFQDDSKLLGAINNLVVLFWLSLLRVIEAQSGTEGVVSQSYLSWYMLESEGREGREGREGECLCGWFGVVVLAASVPPPGAVNAAAL